MIYTYILAPDIDNNFTELSKAAQDFPDLVEEKRIRTVYKKSINDVIAGDGSLLAPADGLTYFYMKVTTAEFDPIMLSGVTDPQVFTKDTQPFETFWI